MTTQINLSWSPVTLNSAGLSLDIPIESYEVSHFHGGNPANLSDPVIVPAAVSSAVLTGKPDGLNSCRVRAIDALGVAGGWTNLLTTDTTQYPPGTPGDFVVSASLDVV